MKKALTVLVTVMMTVALFISCGSDPFFHYVEFDSNGGTEVERQIVRNGEKATKPTDPTKEGTEFIDWYDGDEEFDFDTPITKDYKLTALWKGEAKKTPSGSSSANSHKVAFNVNGGSGTYADQTVEDGGHATKPETNPTTTAKYKTFGFWSADGTTEYKFEEVTVTADITLTAVYRDLTIGDIGEAGGLIFYDVDADNDSGNKDGLTSSTCNWRYLEAAPSDYTKTVEGEPTSSFIFGYYFAAGAQYNSSVITSDNTAVGKGKTNTTTLVETMGSAHINSNSSSATTDDYAAKLCYGWKYEGYSDWFLPSKDELNYMYENLKKKNLGSFTNGLYWSSSEYNEGGSNGPKGLAWDQDFRDGEQAGLSRDRNYKDVYVRPCRQF